MNINNKVTGSIYTAAEWTEFKNEIQNLITSSGQPLASNSLQAKQAVARYVANAASYNDSGVANAYSLSVIGSNDSISSYIDGTKVSFKAGNENTGSSTIAIAGLTAKAIKKDGFSSQLTSGEIKANHVYHAFYSLADDAFELQLGGVTAETVTTTLTVTTGSTYVQIQEILDSVAGVIPYNVNVVIEWENGTYNIGANQLIMPQYSGGGLLVMRAINITGNQTPTKFVTVIGTGAAQGDGTGVGPWQPATAYTLVSVTGNAGLVIAEMAFEMTGDYPGDDISVIRAVRGVCSLQACSLKNISPSTATARFMDVYNAGFGANIHSNQSYFQVPTGTASASQCIVAANTGQFSVNNSAGSGDIAYSVIHSSGHASNDNITSAISQVVEVAGQAYIS